MKTLNKQEKFHILNSRKMQHTPKFKRNNNIRAFNKSTDELVVLAYQRVLGKLFQLLSSIATVGVVLYTFGWLRSFGYYDSFSADWILVDLPFSELISRGIYPLIALLIGLLLTFTDVAKLAADEIRSVLRICVLLLIIELIAFFYLDSIGSYESASHLAEFILILSASCTMLIFGEIVLELKRSDFSLNSDQVWYVITTLASFGGMVMILGNIEGTRDKNPAFSTLAHVVISETSENWRLLTMRNDNLYLVKLTDSLPKIKIIKAEKSEMIVPHKKREKEQEKYESQQNPLPNSSPTKAPQSGVPATTTPKL